MGRPATQWRALINVACDHRARPRGSRCAFARYPTGAGQDPPRPQRTRGMVPPKAFDLWTRERGRARQESVRRLASTVSDTRAPTPPPSSRGATKPITFPLVYTLHSALNVHLGSTAAHTVERCSLRGRRPPPPGASLQAEVRRSDPPSVHNPSKLRCKSSCVSGADAHLIRDMQAGFDPHADGARKRTGLML
jgi:hypothetical protein